MDPPAVQTDPDLDQIDYDSFVNNVAADNSDCLDDGFVDSAFVVVVVVVVRLN